jgi:sterol desaturase/sphingolipid hydroxylase (fatty acid hydroxylase superfamily)
MEWAGVQVDLAGAKDLIWAYVLQFALFSTLAIIARGTKAVQWDADQLRASRVNWAFIAMNAIMAPLAMVLVEGATALFVASPIPRIPAEAWAGLPAIVPALVAVVVADFVDYWSHRVRHTSALWPMHAVHHSDTRMSYLTWYRAHIIELVFITASYAVLAAWMGADPHSVVWVVIVRALHQQYVHMDVDWGHGPLRHMLVSPRYHRWHHADHPDAWNKNYAPILPLWDIAFGTYYCPGPCREKLGFPGSPGENVVALTLLPLREWGRMLGALMRPRQRA